MNYNETVLIIEDDRAICRLLEVTLMQKEYKTIQTHSIKEAKKELNLRAFDLILLDLGLPDGDGKKLLKFIRTELSTPVIIVSAREDEKEIIAALDLGADDYVTKPFQTGELLARIRSTLRRYLQHQNEQIFRCDGLTLCIKEHKATLEASVIKLTPTEFNLLRFLMLHPNQVLTHKQILKQVWGVGYQMEFGYLRTYINSLRKKIEQDTTRPKYIQTESSIGYRFCCNDKE